MNTQILDNIFSEKELFFIYRQIITSPNWSITGTTYKPDYPSNKIFSGCPQLVVKGDNEPVIHYPFYLIGQSIVYRIAKLLEEKKVGMNTEIERMWFNITYSNSDNHHLHPDDTIKDRQTILLFMTPVWQTGWLGSFYVDGQEFEFKPGRAIIFDSTEFHVGDNPSKEIFGWHRLTCNFKTRQ